MAETQFPVLPEPKVAVRYVLQKRSPNGRISFLEEAETMEEAERLLDWWVFDARDPDEMRARMRIVKVTRTEAWEET